MMRGGEEVVFRHSFVDHEIAVAFTRIRRENENAESFSRREILALVPHILVRIARGHGIWAARSRRSVGRLDG